MFCRKCGKAIPDGSVFCPECGASQKEKPHAGVSEGPVKIHSTYIFVVSLIFVIVSGLALISGLTTFTATMSEASVDGGYKFLSALELLLNSVILTLTIFLLVYASSIKKRVESNEPREEVMKALHLQTVFAIVTLIAFGVFLVFEILFMIYVASEGNLTLTLIASFTSRFLNAAAKIGLSVPLVITADQKERLYRHL
jgi:heme/copper-type cytochrome/quinol oxidase subunit 2